MALNQTNAGANIEEYRRTYTSFSGCDIVASFDGIQIGELQGITFSVSRETFSPCIQ